MAFCWIFGHKWGQTNFSSQICSLDVKEWPHTHKITEACVKCGETRMFGVALGNAKSTYCPSWFTHWGKKGNEMTEAGKRKQTIDDVTLEVHQCHHCKAWPTDDEIRAALGWRGRVQPTCAICERQLKYIHEYVTHDPDSGEYSWKSYGNWEPSLTVRSQDATSGVPSSMTRINVWVHAECLLKAIPNYEKHQCNR